MKSGYVEKKIDGVSVGFKFGTNAFQLLTLMHGKEFHEIDEIISNPAGVRDLIFCAYKSYCLVNNLETKLTVYKIGDWLDDLEQSDYEDILRALNSAKVLGTGLQVEESKK